MLLKETKMLLAGLVLAAATPAAAANFAMMPGCGADPADKSCTSIYINGKIEQGDHSRWKALLETTKISHAIVALNSPGGSLPDGLRIAYDILNREYDTYHSEGICYSACALIWLAGKTRYMSSGAKLGFHQSSEADTSRSRRGNDGIFGYYAKLKLSEEAMKYFFSAAPNELALVTVDKAIELGLKPEVWTKPALQPKKPEKLATKWDEIVANGPPQSPEIGALKRKVYDAHMTQQSFGGLRHCSELNGTNFYSPQHDRIFNLEEYLSSLENLAKRHVWMPEDPKEREEKAKRQAQEDMRKCELVLSLPKLEKRLQELQSAAKGE